MAGIIIGVETSTAFSNVKALTKSLNELGKQGIVTESEIKGLTDEFKKKLAAADAERDAAKLGNTLDRVAKSCGMTAGQLADLRTKAGLSAGAMADLNRSITLVHSSATQSAGSLSNSGGTMDMLVGKIGSLAAGYVTLQTAMFAIQKVAAMESLRASFEGIFGDKGVEQFRYVVDAANKYGKSIEDTAGSYRKFAAAADYVGMSTESIRKIFEGTSQAITKVGGSSQDVSGALLAISQSIGKGQVMSEEFRQQFAERIPGAMKMASNAMGVTAGEFQKMMEAGQVMPTEFWPKMADEMAKFSQGWQSSSDTIVSNWERVKNAFSEFVDSDVASGAITGTLKVATYEIKGMTGWLEAFSTKFKAIGAEASGQLSPFEAWITPIDKLKVRLDELTAQRSQYITGMKTEIDSLTKSLADAQAKQLDFGPSGENVEVMRQKLKWFQDLLLQLTGQTYTVNVTANVDTSQLKQAQSYIQEIIKGTSEVKSRTLASESEKLDNAVKVLGKNKADLEAKLSNPNADLREKGGVAQQIEAINKDLDDAKIGYTELQKQQKQLTERQVKDNSEVKKFNESRGGVSGSEVTRDTQKMDAERLSVARQTDAWREYQAGLKTLPEAYEVVTRAQEAETVAKDKITKAIEREGKARSGGANAAAKYAERTSSYLEQAEDQYNQLVAQMGGDSLGAKLAAIEKKYDKAASSIRQAMIGAKGSTAELNATLEVMGASKAIEQQMAQTDAWRKSMQDAANMLGELGRLSGDPQAIYGGEMTTAKLWESDQQARIAAIQDETEREKQLGELRQVMALKEVAARADAYEGVKAVSSEYWAAERQLLEANLATVKATATDETAYKIYAAQQWDEFYKAQMEQQAQTAGSFAETLAAKWSLAFGGYKSETTRAKESWNEMSDSIVKASEGMIDGIAGGFGDMIRNIGNGTASIEDLWKNMLSRMLDMFASFVEDLIKSQLKKMLGGVFSGSDASAGGSGVSLFGGSNSASGGGFDLSSIGSLFKGFGKDAGLGMGEYFSTAGSSASLMVAAGSKNYLSDIFSEGIDASKLGANLWKSTPVDAISEATQASTYASGIGSLASTGTSLLSTIGTTLGVVGAIGGLVGLAASLFGGEEKKKKEPVKLYDGTAQSWSNGSTMSYSMEVMSDGTMKQKTVQPGDIQDTQKAFKDLTDTVKDAAKVFKIDLVDNFVTTFSFMTGIISDELSDTASWVMQGKLGNSALGDLSNAVLFFSDGMQNVVEIFKDLAASASTVKGSLEALGVDFSRFSGVDEQYIAAVADFAVNGIGALSESLDGVASSALSASEYMAKYSKELRALAEAQMASLYEDALGGKDQFQSAMTTYATYGVTSKSEKTSALDYYKGQLGELLDDFQKKFEGVLGNFGGANIDITDIDSFWSAYNAAMQQSMSPSMLAAWAEMASYAQLISSTAKDLDAVNLAESQWNSSITARRQLAAGLDKEAALTKALAGYEKELADARSNGMTYAQQAQLVQAEIDEMQADYDKLTGVSVDYASSLDAALSKFVDTLSTTIERLSEVSSTASSLASTWEGISDGLDSAIESMKEDSGKDLANIIAYKTKQLEDAYTKGMAGDSEMMAKVAGYATSLWDTAKAGSKTPEQYDTAFWTIQNRLATAKAISGGMSEYEKTISSLTGKLVDIAGEIKKELESDSPDAGFLTLAKTLYAYTEDFQKYVDLYKAGRVSESDFNSAAKNSYDKVSGWIAEFIDQNAKISADQVRALVTENQFIQAAIADGSNLTAAQLSSLYTGTEDIGASTIQSIMGQSEFLKEIMSGNIELSGLSRQQASILSSALTAMETISGYTGESLKYSDTANYYLSKISDGLSTAGWDGLIKTISDGQDSLKDAMSKGIASLNVTLNDLLAKAKDQTDTVADQAKYFESIKQALYQQTQIELYTSLVATAKNTATGYENYAMSALLTGTSMGIIVAMQWMEKQKAAQAEVDTMTSYLNYWKNYQPTALADGGIVTAPTLAYIGEGRENEAVIPLSKLNTMITSGKSDEEMKKLLIEILAEMRLNTDTTKLVADRVYSRDQNKPFAARF